jgi:hypothetical protein
MTQLVEGSLFVVTHSAFSHIFMNYIGTNYHIALLMPRLECNMPFTSFNSVRHLSDTVALQWWADCPDIKGGYMTVAQHSRPKMVTGAAALAL